MGIIPAEGLPMGWRFSPTDEELISYFLKRKNSDPVAVFEEIPEIDVCKWEPSEIPELVARSSTKSDDQRWFFFSLCDRKYARGKRLNRKTKLGHWKSTGKDRKIKSRSSGLIGKKKTLVFYEGRARKVKKTNWVMHEYQTTENDEDGKEGSFILFLLKLNEDENSNSDNVKNDNIPSTDISFNDNTQLGVANEQFETPLNQGITESDEQAPHCLVDASDDGALDSSLHEPEEVGSLEQSFLSDEHLQYMSLMDCGMNNEPSHPYGDSLFCNDDIGMVKHDSLLYGGPAENIPILDNPSMQVDFETNEDELIGSYIGFESEPPDSDLRIIGNLCFQSQQTISECSLEESSRDKNSTLDFKSMQVDFETNEYELIGSYLGIESEPRDSDLRNFCNLYFESHQTISERSLEESSRQKDSIQLSYGHSGYSLEGSSRQEFHT